MLHQPGPTPYDLTFRIGPVPVRISVWFWVLGLVLGGTGASDGRDLIQNILVYTVAIFISILVHELGHVVMYNHFGIRAKICLYMMGGLAIPDRGGLRPQQSILVSLAGPAAGFLLAGLVLLTVHTTGGHAVYAPVFKVIPDWNISPQAGAPLIWGKFLNAMMFINIYWGLMNLLPVFPLDGGQVARAIFELSERNTYNPRRGSGAVVNSLKLSIVVGAALAIWGISQKDLWLVYLFGSLTYFNYQDLQRNGGGF